MLTAGNIYTRYFVLLVAFGRGEGATIAFLDTVFFTTYLWIVVFSLCLFRPRGVLLSLRECPLAPEVAQVSFLVTFWLLGSAFGEAAGITFRNF